jgi:hypothetical protein
MQKISNFAAQNFKAMNITDDSNNIYIKDYTVPKGRAKEDIKAREKIINAIYRKWTAENPEKCVYNEALKDFIHVKFESINETVNKAARNYNSTMAMFHLTEILKDAKVVKCDKPDKSTKNQAKYTQMIIMQWEKVKLMVGEKSTGLKIQYCITSLEQ